MSMFYVKIFFWEDAFFCTIWVREMDPQLRRRGITQIGPKRIRRIPHELSREIMTVPASVDSAYSPW